ncbi:hypothetical protein GDO86_014854, partial [Hymenochirus boettgeri]
FCSVYKEPNVIPWNKVSGMKKQVKDDKRKQVPSVKGSRRPLMAQCSVSRKLSFNSQSSSRNGIHGPREPYGASAWREGQKIVRKILGPAPKTQYVSRGEEIMDQNLGNYKNVIQSMGTETRLRKNESPEEGLLDPKRGKVEIPHRGVPWSSNAVKRTKSFSPKKENNVTRKHLDKENVKQEEEFFRTGNKISGYSVEEVRNFMSKKNMERKSKEREQKRFLQEAEQLKQKCLQEVFRKQKEAHPLKKPRTNIATRIKDPLWKPEVQAESPDLLSEAKGRNMTQKQTKESVYGHSSKPLRVQDLDTPEIPPLQPYSGFHSASPERSSEPRQYREGQERLQALCTIAEELGRRVELEASRLGTGIFTQATNSKDTAKGLPRSMEGSPESGVARRLSANQEGSQYSCKWGSAEVEHCPPRTRHPIHQQECPSNEPFKKR